MREGRREERHIVVAGKYRESPRPARPGVAGPTWPTGIPLLGVPPAEAEPHTTAERPERVVCVSVGIYIFTDPLWGPVCFDFSVWRHLDDDQPSYEVVIE